ncbi:hypothetical protein OG21DRAFT_1492201 [Imleria badia]|nr:hypothetical protein OG21DRAFT_1492201 [Imleria badia]
MQKLGDIKKEVGSNKEALQHWQMEHDKLRLHEHDDDENKDEEEEPARKPFKPRQPSNELHIYSVDELAQFRKRDLVADFEYLDGTFSDPLHLWIARSTRKSPFKDLDQITDEHDTQKQKYDTLRKQRLDKFMAGFSLISLKLKEMYQMITLGGNMELESVDSMDLFSEGIIFSVMPPKKS